MTRVIIESPYAGDIEANTEYAQRCLRDSINRNEVPFASHLLYTQVLDDNDPVQRALGINTGLTWLQIADKMAVYTDLGISKGMQAAINYAKVLRIPIDYREL